MILAVTKKTGLAALGTVDENGFDTKPDISPIRTQYTLDVQRADNYSETKSGSSMLSSSRVC